MLNQHSKPHLTCSKPHVDVVILLSRASGVAMPFILVPHFSQKILITWFSWPHFGQIVLHFPRLLVLLKNLTRASTGFSRLFLLPFHPLHGFPLQGG
jgi:hypothetical protein